MFSYNQNYTPKKASDLNHNRTNSNWKGIVQSTNSALPSPQNWLFTGRRSASTFALFTCIV